MIARVRRDNSLYHEGLEERHAPPGPEAWWARSVFTKERRTALKLQYLTQRSVCWGPRRRTRKDWASRFLPTICEWKKRLLNISIPQEKMRLKTSKIKLTFKQTYIPSFLPQNPATWIWKGSQWWKCVAFQSSLIRIDKSVFIGDEEDSSPFLYHQVVEKNTDSTLDLVVQKKHSTLIPAEELNNYKTTCPCLWRCGNKIFFGK